MYALLALLMGENAKTSDLAKDAAQMVCYPPLSHSSRCARCCAHCCKRPRRLSQVANVVLMKYGRKDEARARARFFSALTSPQTDSDMFGLKSMTKAGDAWGSARGSGYMARSRVHCRF